MFLSHRAVGGPIEACFCRGSIEYSFFVFGTTCSCYVCPWKSDEAYGCWSKDLEVSWVDSGYVELIAWGRPWKSDEAWGRRLVNLMVSWVGSDSESDGIVGVMTFVNPLKSDKAWGCRLDDLLVSLVDSDSEYD